jgi:hypothetical protein
MGSLHQQLADTKKRMVEAEGLAAELEKRLGERSPSMAAADVRFRPCSSATRVIEPA